MILTNTGKKFVYASVIMMLLSMVLPWDSLEDYTYSESMGLLMNVIPAVIFVCAVAIVVLKPLALLLSKIGTNIVFLLWGSYAQKKGDLLDKGKNLVLKAPHPSPLSAHRGFFGCKHFSQCNNFLKSQGEQPVSWLLL